MGQVNAQVNLNETNSIPVQHRNLDRNHMPEGGIAADPNVPVLTTLPALGGFFRDKSMALLRPDLVRPTVIT